MPYINPNDFGPLAPVVAHAGYIIAAAGMLLLIFKGRGSWHPVDEAIPKVSQKTAVLITGVLVAISFYWMRDETSAGNVTVLALVVLFTLIVSFPLYIWLNSRFVYQMPYLIAIPSPNGGSPTHSTVMSNVAGGEPTPQAMALLSDPVNPIPLSEQLKGCNQNPDLVFDPASRAMVKTALQCIYVVFIVSILLLLSLGAIILTHVN